jgi:RNA polymerase sigma-70 factor (ECF subfamily)
MTDSMQMAGSARTPAGDEEPVRRFQEDPNGAAGRVAATELFEPSQERVYLWCARRVRDHETALDLAQDALLSAYGGLRTYEGRCSYASWVFAITRNRCFRAMRPRGLRLDEEVDAGELPSKQKHPDVCMEGKEDEEALLALIQESLEPQERLAIWLRCFESLSVDEITRRLGIHGAAGARGTLQNARRKLPSALERDRAHGRRGHR